MVKRISFKVSDFRGYGHAMGVPEIGSKIDRCDYNEEFHQVTVLEHGAHWSNSSTGRSGWWIIAEAPDAFVTRQDVERGMRSVMAQYE